MSKKKSKKIEEVEETVEAETVVAETVVEETVEAETVVAESTGGEVKFKRPCHQKMYERVSPDSRIAEVLVKRYGL